MHPRSAWLREGDPRRRGVMMRGLRLVLSAHDHVVVEWPTTSFGYVEVATHHGRNFLKVVGGLARPPAIAKSEL